MPINGFVYVIESPSPIDLLDGRTEGRVLTDALQLAGIPHWYSLAVDKSMLLEALSNRLVQAWQFHDKLPILHLSMHGNADGVQLSNGEFLTWHDLRQALTPLNRAIQGGILVCMSSCFGSAGCRMAMYADTEPHFAALVGNTASATWADAAIAYISFYHLLFKGIGLELCVQSMGVASGDHNFVFHIGSEMKAGWTAYLHQQRDQIASGISQAADETNRKRAI